MHNIFEQENPNLLIKALLTLQTEAECRAFLEDIMTTIVKAFEKQLDSLFGSDALDISTDISVLESMLIQEGLAGEQMQAGSDGIRLDL